MLDQVERHLARALEKLLAHPVVIGVPDPRWYRAQGIPAASIKVAKRSYLEWISSGSPDSEEDLPDNKVKQTWSLAECKVIFVLHLFDLAVTRLEQNEFKLASILARVNTLPEFCSLASRLADSPGLLLLDQGDCPQGPDQSEGTVPLVDPIPNWSTGLLEVEDSDPGPEDERVIERIISIPLSGDLELAIIVDKTTLEWQLAISPEVES